MLRRTVDSLGKICAPNNRLRVIADETEPVFDFDPLTGYVERQENDTVLASAGLHLAKGSLYYGLHVRQLYGRESMKSSVMPALKAIANKARELSKAQQRQSSILESYRNI